MISKDEIKKENILLQSFFTYIGEFLCFIPELIYNKNNFLIDIKKNFINIVIICFFLLIIDSCEIFNKFVMIKYNVFFYVDN